MKGSYSEQEAADLSEAACAAVSDGQKLHPAQQNSAEECASESLSPAAAEYAAARIDMSIQTKTQAQRPAPTAEDAMLEDLGLIDSDEDETAPQSQEELLKRFADQPVSRRVRSLRLAQVAAENKGVSTDLYNTMAEAKAQAESARDWLHSDNDISMKLDESELAAVSDHLGSVHIRPLDNHGTVAVSIPSFGYIDDPYDQELSLDEKASHSPAMALVLDSDGQLLSVASVSPDREFPFDLDLAEFPSEEAWRWKQDRLSKDFVRAQEDLYGPGNISDFDYVEFQYRNSGLPDAKSYGLAKNSEGKVIDWRIRLGNAVDSLKQASLEPSTNADS